MIKVRVDQSDLIGQIEGAPLEVVQEMVNEQIAQGNEADVTIFQKDIRANVNEGGFTWSKSKNGYLYFIGGLKECLVRIPTRSE